MFLTENSMMDYAGTLKNQEVYISRASVSQQEQLSSHQEGSPGETLENKWEE
jgi:hypothetical protein